MAYVRVKIRVVRGCWQHSRALNAVRRLTASCCHPGHNNTHHTYTRAISQTYKHVHSGTHTDTHTYTQTPNHQPQTHRYKNTFKHTHLHISQRRWWNCQFVWTRGNRRETSPWKNTCTPLAKGSCPGSRRNPTSRGLWRSHNASVGTLARRPLGSKWHWTPTARRSCHVAGPQPGPRTNCCRSKTPPGGLQRSYGDTQRSKFRQRSSWLQASDELLNIKRLCRSLCFSTT